MGACLPHRRVLRYIAASTPATAITSLSGCHNTAHHTLPKRLGSLLGFRWSPRMYLHRHSYCSLDGQQRHERADQPRPTGQPHQPPGCIEVLCNGEPPPNVKQQQHSDTEEEVYANGDGKSFSGGCLRIGHKVAKRPLQQGQSWIKRKPSQRTMAKVPLVISSQWLLLKMLF
jgi:hypothetical protein